MNYIRSAPSYLHGHHAEGDDQYLGEGEDVVLVELEARVLQAQAELLPLESVEVPGGRVSVAVDHAALALATETQAGSLQQTVTEILDHLDNYK